MATKSAKKTTKKTVPAAKNTATKKSAAKNITAKKTTAKKTDKKVAAKTAVKKDLEKEKPKKNIAQIKSKETMKKGIEKKTEAKSKKELLSKEEPKKAATKQSEVKKAGVNKIEDHFVDEQSVTNAPLEEKQTETVLQQQKEDIHSKEENFKKADAHHEHTVVEVTSPKKNIRKVKGYSKEDLEYFKKIILDKRNEIIEQLQNLREQMMDPTTGQYVNENSPYSLHMAEQGTDAMEREKIFLWAQRENKFLGYLDDALHRIENGTYGICIECIDEPQYLCPTCPLISKERLAAVPHSQLCLPVKQKQEKK
ncbi:MAG: conjugal transfer protein TraR [Bacteroidota bacterium]|nr:conjugal transfer protein TraR [Bacteroidota bacterium]